jgi:hypothetical protein
MRFMKIVAAVLVFVSMASAVFAAAPSTRDARVLILHASPSTYDLQSWPPTANPTTGAPFKKKVRFTILPGEEVSIVIANPNPFLYTYTLGDLADTRTANAEAAASFTKSLLNLINGLEPPKKVGLASENPILLAALTPQDIFFPIDEMGQAIPSSEIALEDALTFMDLASPENQARIYSEAIETVRRNQVPIPDNIDFFAPLLADVGIKNSSQFIRDFKASVARAILLSGQVKSLITQIDQGKGDQAKSAVEDWKLAELSDRLDSDYRKMDAAVNAIVEELQKSLSNDEKARLKALSDAACMELMCKIPCVGCKEISSLPAAKTLKEQTKREEVQKKKKEFDDLLREAAKVEKLRHEIPSDTFYIALNFARDRERDVRDSLNSLRQFTSDMKKVNQPLVLGTVTYADAAIERHRKLTIAKVQNLPDGLTPARDIEVYELDFQPFSAVQLGVGGALVYSFVKKHHFEASPENGSFRVTDTEEGQFSGTNVAAMMTIVPRFWADSDFHPLFEVGVKPEDDLGLYAGFGVKFLGAFSFGAGVAFERRDQLGPGLSVGQVLDSKDKFKTEKRFETGFYLHLTASTDFGTNN